MACFNLIDCTDPASPPMWVTDDILNPTLVVGQVITCNEVPGHCLLVQDGGGQCSPIIITGIVVYADCQTCTSPPCNCPQGTIFVTLPDGTTACQQESVVLAEGPQLPIGCQKLAQAITAVPQGPAIFGRSPDYCKLGANFYPETAGRPWPINFNSLCAPGTQNWTDFSSTLVPAIAATSNTLWGTGAPGFDGRFNLVGVNLSPTNPCGGGAITFGKYGFTFCLNVPTTTTYCFGFGGMGIEILINGAQFITTLREDNYQYEKWSVVQLTLPAGSYIIQMSAYSDYGGTNTCGQPSFPTSFPFTPVGFAFEIYQATALALSAMTSTLQLAPVLVYSTVNEFGQKMDYGDPVFNYRCPCAPPPVTCPTSFGQFNVIKPVLDNCTVNPLNPNANPDIYVCHTYTYTPISPCCYVLTDCQNPSITYITNTDLSSYIGDVITVTEYVGCFIVSLAQDCASAVPVTFIQSFGSASAPNDGCALCAPKCYMLEDCNNIIPPFVVNTDLSLYVGLTVQLCPTPGVVTFITECGCFIVTLAGGCQGAIPLPGTIINSYQTCEDCLPKCFKLTDCQDTTNVIITNTDLSAYLTQVIFIDGCPGTCWIVSTSDNCIGAIPVVIGTIFTDCDTCLGIPPIVLELHPRKVKPGYDTPGCDPAYTEKINCNFAKAVYDQMLIKRYGVTMCCNDPIQKWDIKKQLLDLRALYDPNLCKNTIDKCCPPCALVVELVVYETSTCDPPTGIIATIEIPPELCPEPENLQAAISIP